VSRLYQAGAKYGNGEFIQVHPTAVPGADKLRLMSESARGEGGRVWVPRKPQDPRKPKEIPESERYYFLEERYPKYKNLVPRDIATREIFKVCTEDNLSVDPEKMCVYLDLTHIDRKTLDIKLGGILSIYEKFQGVDPRDEPMKIFPAVHYSMGGLWVDYEKSASGGLLAGSPKNHQTNLPGIYAIGECDYQYHGANRLGANSLLSCIFSGLVTAGSVESRLKSLKGGNAADQPNSLYDNALNAAKASHNKLLNGTGGGENPYLIHQELGNVMTKAATVVRVNSVLSAALDQVRQLEARAAKCSLSDTGNWTNQNVIFTKSLRDMFPIAKLILKGALQRDECRGAHYKPEFESPGLSATELAEKQKQAEEWCDRFAANTAKWLKSTISVNGADNEPQLTYEDVDTTLSPPKPRLYGMVGGELIEQVWKKRSDAKVAALGSNGNGSLSSTGAKVGAT
jgi:succinate dehydrogenase / fumarate reductase flavoprotein subunit